MTVRTALKFTCNACDRVVVMESEHDMPNVNVSWLTSIAVLPSGWETVDMSQGWRVTPRHLCRECLHLTHRGTDA